MKINSFVQAPFALLAVACLGSNALAQSGAVPVEVKPMCQSVAATVMVGNTTCTAALCNTGASQGGFNGVLALAMNRQAIDAVSFSNGVGAMLSTALKQTGCFEVFDAAGMEQLRKDMESLGRKLASPSSVDYVVRASITQADYNVAESNILGYSKKTTTASVTIDTKLVSTSSGTVSEAGSYDASSEKSYSGVVGIYASGNDGRRGNPFSDVARDAVAKAAVALTTKILSQNDPSRLSNASASRTQAIPAAASAPQ